MLSEETRSSELTSVKNVLNFLKVSVFFSRTFSIYSFCKHSLTHSHTHSCTLFVDDAFKALALLFAFNLFVYTSFFHLDLRSSRAKILQLFNAMTAIRCVLTHTHPSKNIHGSVGVFVNGVRNV